MQATIVAYRFLNVYFGVTCVLTSFFSIVFQIYPPILPSTSQFNLQSLYCPLHEKKNCSSLLYPPHPFLLGFTRPPCTHSSLLSSPPNPHPPSPGCCTSSRTSPWTLCRPTSVPCSWTTATPRPGWTWARCMSPATSRTTPSSATSTPHAARAAPTPPR